MIYVEVIKTTLKSLPHKRLGIGAKMREKIIKILEDIHPEIDFTKESRDLILSGILESFDVVQIISDLEDTFNIKISGLELTSENFSSVDSILKLVESKQGK